MGKIPSVLPGLSKWETVNALASAKGNIQNHCALEMIKSYNSSLQQLSKPKLWYLLMHANMLIP